MSDADDDYDADDDDDDDDDEADDDDADDDDDGDDDADDDDGSCGGEVHLQVNHDDTDLFKCNCTCNLVKQ